jgi:hypothetical protein
MGKFKETIEFIKELLLVNTFLYRCYENYEFAQRLSASHNESSKVGYVSKLRNKRPRYPRFSFPV